MRSLPGLPLELGDAIQNARLQRGWTVRRAAQRCGIQPGYLAAIELGRRQPPAAVAQAIARVLLHDRPHAATALLERTRDGEPAAIRTNTDARQTPP